MPENSLEDNIWNGFLKDSKVINTLIKWIQIEKSSGFIFGTVIKSDRRTDKGLNNHFDRNFKISYSEFGSSIFLDSTGNTQVHLKRKLVPKEEYLPSIFKETTLRSSKLTHGFDYNNIRFKNCNLVSLICYESFFGEDVAKCVQDSGEAIIMIANQQIFPFNHTDEFYTNICKIRAIENSKFFLKVSNMGISCLINPFGDIVKQNDLKKASILSTELPLTKTQTFYTKYAFYIHWIYLLQPLLLIFIISACVKRK